jgi:hypothetical protein
MNWTFDGRRRAVLGLILVGIGVMLLPAQVFGNAAHYLWPFFIIAPGAALAAVAVASGGAMRNLAVPGTVIAGIGVILFFQNTFDHYESWAYAWALIPFFVGAGTRMVAQEETGDRGSEWARHLMTWSLTAFVLLAAIFELLIFGGGGLVARIVVQLLLIAAGVAVILGWIGAGHAMHEPGGGEPKR